MELLNQMKRHGYELTLTCNEFRQGKEMVTLLSDEEIHYDVFFTQVQSVDTQIIIELLCVEKEPKSFRIQFRVPNVFRVVDTWKSLGDDDVKPILENIKELEREMKRELIEIDCI